MQGLDSKFHVFSVNQNGNLDLRCRDNLDIDTLGTQYLEHLGRDPSVAAHADADNGHFGDVNIRDQLRKIDGSCIL